MSERKLMTVNQAREHYQLCRNALIKSAEEADAVFKVGGSVRIDTEKMDSYFREKYKR